MEKKIRLFIDIEGCIARFYEMVSGIEEMYNKEFFLNLHPYHNVVNGITTLYRKAKANEIQLELFALSSAPSEIYEEVIEDKRKWLQKYVPAIPDNNYVFLKIGESKPDKIKSLFGEIDSSFFLLDDFNKNLTEWNEAGGSSIKLVNEINDRGTHGPLWRGDRIRYDFTPDKISSELSEMLNLQYVLYKEPLKAAFCFFKIFHI